MLMWHKHMKEKHQTSSGLSKHLPVSWNWVWVGKGREEREQQEETAAVALHKPARCQKYRLKNRDTWQQIDLRLCLIQSSNLSIFSPRCHSESPQPHTLVSSWNCCSAGCCTQNYPQSKVHQQKNFSLKQKWTNLLLHLWVYSLTHQIHQPHPCPSVNDCAAHTQPTAVAFHTTITTLSAGPTGDSL